MIAFWFPRSVKTEIDDSDTASLVHPKGLTTTFRCMISTMDTLSPYSNSFPYYCNIPWVKTCTWKKKFDVDDDLHAKWQEVHKILVSITKLDLKTSSTEQKLMSGWVYDPRSRFFTSHRYWTSIIVHRTQCMDRECRNKEREKNSNCMWYIVITHHKKSVLPLGE